MTPKNVLREEHGETMKMLLVLQGFSKIFLDLEEGEAKKDLQELIEFFEIYVDACHHGKEEQLLFPALSHVQSAEIDSLISSLLHDHFQARVFMEQIKSRAGTFYPGSRADLKAFNEGAERYVELIRKHIRKENSALLPLIDESLSETDRLQLAKQFHELNKANLGSSRLEAFRANVRDLSQKYSPEKI